MTVTGVDVLRLRRRLKMNRKEFSRRYGISYWSLRDWETRDVTPDPTSARKILAIERQVFGMEGSNHVPGANP